MDNRPIKSNPQGKYDLSFVDPTNDICAYYSGMTDLAEQVEKYLETVTYHRIARPQLGGSQLFGKTIEKQIYMDHCSVCLQKFKEGESVRVLACKHCFHGACVLPWFEQNTCCPNCRAELPIRKQ